MLSEKIEKYVIERTEEFKKELNEEVKQMIKEAKQGQVKSVWDLKHNDKCYALYGDGDIVEYGFKQVLEAFRESGNIFLTKEEAEFELERRRVEVILRKYSRPFKKEEQNWYLYYSCNIIDNTIDTGVVYEINPGVPLFETKKIALKAMEEIGHDKLKKYWFGVK